MINLKIKLKLIVLGKVDAGKSTTVGHLLYRCGEIPAETITKYENEARVLERESFKYTWVLDQLRAEREQGLTSESLFSAFETPTYNCKIIDTSGHRNFLKNLITGATKADVALLLIDSTFEASENGSFASGLTRDQATLAYLFGINQIIVGVNKMDRCEYSEVRYHEIREEMLFELHKIGYLLENITFIPISGWIGDNLMELSENMPWYNGPTLLTALNNLSPPHNLSSYPLRLPLQVVYKIGGIGTVPAGQVLTGVLKEGMRIAFTPSGLQSFVQSIETRQSGLNEACAGDNIGFHCPGIGVHDVERGEVVSDPLRDPAHGCLTFQAEIMIQNILQPLVIGYTPMLAVHTTRVAVIFRSFDAKLERRTGQIIEQNPSVLRSGDVCLVTLEPVKSTVVEELRVYPPLGRFLIREGSETVAVGVVIKVQKVSELLGKGARKR